MEYMILHTVAFRDSFYTADVNIIESVVCSMEGALDSWTSKNGRGLSCAGTEGVQERSVVIGADETREE